MVKISEIKFEAVKTLGFLSKNEFNIFIYANDLKSIKNEKEKDFLKRVKKQIEKNKKFNLKLLKKEQEKKQKKIEKKIEKQIIEEKKQIKGIQQYFNIISVNPQQKKEEEDYIRQQKIMKETELKFIEIAKRQQEERKINYKNVLIKLEQDIKNLNNNIIEIARIELIDKDTEQRLYNDNQLLEIFKTVLINRAGIPTVFTIDFKNYYTMNENNKNRFLDELTTTIAEESSDSANSSIISIRQLAEFIAFKNVYKKPVEDLFLSDEEEQPTIRYNKKKGAFFKYLNNTDINLDKYGIYKVFNYGSYDATSKFNKEEYENGNYKNNCLYEALKEGGLEESKLNEIKIYFKNRHIAVDNIKKLCYEIDIKIIVKCIKKKDGTTQNITYGDNEDEIYNIGLLDEHYFINDKTNYTRYAIENYFEIKNKNRFNHIYNKKGDKDENRTINSFELIRIYLENKDKYLIPIEINEQLLLSNHYDKFKNDDIENLNYDEDIIRENNEVKKREEKEEEKEEDKDDYKLVFFDAETDPNEIHKAYLICSIDESNKINSFSGDDCAIKFLKSLKTNSLLIAHNAGYDFRFIYEHLTIKKYVSKGKKLMFCLASYNKIKIKIIDSLNMINMPLRKFKESFDKDYIINKDKENYIIKEVMPYKFYNQDNIKKIYCSIDEALKYIDKKEDKEQFINNIDRWNLRYPNNKYDIIEYSKRYCIIDCEILKFGYMKFREWMIDITNLDIKNFVSLPSIAHEYLINRGCYDNIYYLQGIPQIFISRCIVGGRTMLKDNKKQQTKENINDFDGVSLYPSAMNAMKGFLQGLPKVIKKDNLNYDYIKNKDGYFVKILIKSIGINRHFPLGSEISDDGTRNFTNDLINKYQYVDNYALEDLIEFQKIEFDIIQGYYFEEGVNNKINSVMLELFNERLKKKKEENPTQIIFKELMNSSYGKTILKPIEYETKIFNTSKEYNSFINRNYEFVSDITILSGDEDKHRCKRIAKVIKNIMVHKNIPQVGVQVLSYSKRIMNKVICTAEDNNIDIYYQDTDSMHLKDIDISKLKEVYFNKYGLELEGKKLGQFHSDFELEGCKNVISKKALFVAKKIYIDELEGVDIKTGEIKTGLHYRMKGISDEGIIHSTKLNNCSIWDIYQKLYNEEEILIDIGAGGKKPIFKVNKDFTIETLEKMEKKIYCKNK